MIVNRFESFARSTATRFAKDVRGNLTMVTSLAAIPLIAAAGMAIDYGRISRAKDQLQIVADSAVIAAASAQNLTGNSEEKVGKRKKIAENYVTAALANVSDLKIIGQPQIVSTSSSVSVDINAAVEGSLMNVVRVGRSESAETGEGSGGNQDGSSGGLEFDLTVGSKANFSPGLSYICMLALNPSVAQALSVTGTADIKAEQCAIQVNSTSATGLYQNGAATVKASSICVTGNYGGSAFTPMPKTSCGAFNDPLAAQFAIDYNATYASAPVRYNSPSNMTFWNGANTISPGRYVSKSGIRIDNGTTVNMQPGTYYIDGGVLDVRAGGVLNGTGVTIIFTGSANAYLNVQAGGSMNVKAPAAGRFAGIVVANHPSFVPVSPKSHKVIGGGQLNLEGILYYPKQNFLVTGNGVGTVTNLSTAAKQFAIVADTITVQGNGQVNVGQSADFDAAGLPALPATGNGTPVVSLAK